MSNMFIINISIITVVLYYCYIITLLKEEKEGTEEKINPIIVLYNFIKDEYITFLTLDDFYRNILNRGDAGAMIEYLRKHGSTPESMEEVKELINLYFKGYEIKKLDL